MLGERRTGLLRPAAPPRTLLLCLILLAGAALSFAQTGGAVAQKPPAAAEATAVDGPRPLRVNVDLVLVPVTVTDPMNRIVTGLEKENFTVFENGERQTISSFASEDAPLSLGILFDMSGSMRDKVEMARKAVSEFCQSANPQDEFFLVAFNDKPAIVSGFNPSVEAIESALAYVKPQGRTALLDAIYLAVRRMREAKNDKKALLILSDGGDNNSHYSSEELRALIREADVQIYAMGVFDWEPETEEERGGPALLTEIADATGGRMLELDDARQLPEMARLISVELRNQYLIAYRPSRRERDGKWRKIRVKVQPPKGLPLLTVNARSGYYAPAK